MNLQDQVIEALGTLGVDTPYPAVAKWVKQKYGVTPSDGTFYNARKLFRQRTSEKKGAPMQGKTVVTAAVTPVKSDDKPSQDREVTVDELKRTSDFAKDIGGLARLQLILNVLNDLRG